MGQVRVVATTSGAMDLARGVLEANWPQKDGVWGIVAHGGWFYEWYGGVRWVARDKRWMENEVWRSLDGAVVRRVIEGGTVEKGVVPKVRTVQEVVRAIEVLCESPYEKVPVWLGGGEGKPVASRCVAFRDAIVDVDASRVATAQKRSEGIVGPLEACVVTIPRTREYFGPVLNAEWGDGSGECPVWDACMAGWSQGEEGWVELRERAYGYALMADRSRDKFLFEFGKPRSGKGMGTNVVLRGLLGTPACMGVRAQDFTDKHGLEGLEQAQVVVVGEASDMDRRDARSLAGLVKTIVGADQTRVNPKGSKMLPSTLTPFIVMQANEVPDLPNIGGGLTSKMLPLWFGRSHVGKEDHRLREKLKGELSGIGQRLVKALVRLEVEGVWPMPASSRAVIEEFDEVNNQFDTFLSQCFIKGEGHWVQNDLIRRVRGVWEERTKERLMWRGKRVSDQHLIARLVANSSWELRKRRPKADGPWGVDGLRVLEKAM